MPAALPAGMVGGAASAVAQAGEDVRPRVTDGGRKPEDQRRDDRRRRGEDQDRAVDANPIEARNGVRRELQQDRQGHRREQHAEHRADRRERQRFREQLPHQPGAAAAERHAHRDLPLARLGANQAEVGDVAARDEQDHADRAEQDPQRLAHAADQVLLHRVHQGTVTAVCEKRAIVGALDVPAHRPAHQRLEMCRRLVRPHAFLQPADRAPAETAGRRRRGIEARGQPHVRRSRVIHPGRGDADYLRWLAVRRCPGRPSRGRRRIAASTDDG